MTSSRIHSQTNFQVTRWIPLVLATLATAFYGATVLKYSANFPFWDDYDAILGFLNQREERNFLASFYALFDQHNEHRIALPRLIELAVFKIVGEVNFVHLIFVGNIGWLLTIFAIWKFSIRNSVSTAEFVPFVMLMLAFSHAELMTWAMASIQQYYQIFFAIMTITMMVKNRPNSTLILFIASSFSGGGGLALAPVIAGYYVHSRNWRRLGVALLVISALIAVYFPLLSYRHPSHHPAVWVAFSEPLRLAGYFVTFLGGFGKSATLSIAIGLAAVLLFSIKQKQIGESAPFVYWSVIYIFLVTFLNAITRSGLGIEYAASSRYTVYSLLLGGFLYLGYLSAAKTSAERRIVQGVGMSCSLIVFLYWSLPGADRMEDRFWELEAKRINYPHVNKALQILQQSSDLGIFNARDSLPTRQAVPHLTSLPD